MHPILLAPTMNFRTQPEWFEKICRTPIESVPWQAHVTSVMPGNDAGNYRDRFIINLSDARCPENKIAIDAAWNNARGGVDVSFLGRACVRDSACY